MSNDYVVTCIGGFRQANLSLPAAVAAAEKIVQEWAEVGRKVEARVYYNGTGELIRTVTSENTSAANRRMG